MQPDLSIIILTFNTQALTLACLRSVLPNPCIESFIIEVIVVDNASTDGTAEAVRAEFPQVQVIVNASNAGFARGNNVGLAAARGRYLLALNSDTEVRPGALEALITYMDTHPDVGACGPMLLNSDGSLQPSGRPLPSLWSVLLDMTKLHRLWKRDVFSERGRDYSAPAYVGEISGAALLVRREVYAQVGGFDEHIFAYYEDVDWCHRIGAAGYKIGYVPQAQVMHHWRSTSRTVSELSYRAGQNSLRYYFRKHHGPLAQCAIQALLAAKEWVLLAASTLKRNSAARQFHHRMLANVFSPLPTGAPV